MRWWFELLSNTLKAKNHKERRTTEKIHLRMKAEGGLTRSPVSCINFEIKYWQY
jgi:hypothetical protein